MYTIKSSYLLGFDTPPRLVAVFGVPMLFAQYHLGRIFLLDRRFFNGQVQGGPFLLDKDTIERLGWRECRTPSPSGLVAELP